METLEMRPAISARRANTIAECVDRLSRYLRGTGQAGLDETVVAACLEEG
jgi:hypothetical protein